MFCEHQRKKLRFMAMKIFNEFLPCLNVKAHLPYSKFLSELRALVVIQTSNLKFLVRALFTLKKKNNKITPSNRSDLMTILEIVCVWEYSFV